jgi:hypothetical protein
LARARNIFAHRDRPIRGYDLYDFFLSFSVYEDGRGESEGEESSETVPRARNSVRFASGIMLNETEHNFSLHEAIAPIVVLPTATQVLPSTSW